MRVDVSLPERPASEPDPLAVLQSAVPVPVGHAPKPSLRETMLAVAGHVGVCLLLGAVTTLAIAGLVLAVTRTGEARILGLEALAFCLPQACMGGHAYVGIIRDRVAERRRRR